jgi:hypothetical protein
MTLKPLRRVRRLRIGKTAVPRVLVSVPSWFHDAGVVESRMVWVTSLTRRSRRPQRKAPKTQFRVSLILQRSEKSSPVCILTPFADFAVSA